MTVPGIVERTFVDDVDEGRICQDIPDAACDDQPQAFTYQLIAQTLTKLADAIVSPRLVLAWMLSVAGTPSLFIAMLVPVRESCSLLPQLFIAKYLRERPIRKSFWVAGAIGQALALAGMIPAILFTEGAITGVLVILLLVLFSLCRGINSITAKDVLGKTISKSRRGRLNGLSASAAGFVTLSFAVVLMASDQLAIAEPISLFVFLLIAAVGLWLVSAAVYARIPEVPGATEGGGSAIEEALKNLALVITDTTLRRFIIARSLMVAAGISIPYIVFLVQQQSASFGGLGALMVAEGLAALVSGHFWGTWSDRASHHVMAAAAALCTVMIGTVITIQLMSSQWLGLYPIAGSLLFVAALAHQGIRIGRKTYLVDIASSVNRAQYVAVSNTIIGVVVASTALFGVIDELYGTVSVLVALCLISFVGMLVTLRLPGVDQTS